MFLKKVFLFLLIFASVLNISAYEVKDIDGISFDFSEPPRIASITPSVSEIVCGLGMADRLLGVSRYCEYPDQVKLKPRIGGFIDPDYEKIITLKPDLIILPKTSDSTVRDRLARLGIRCFLIYPDGIESIPANVELIGAIFQKEKEAAEISSQIRNAVCVAETECRPKAVFLFGKMAAGKRSFAGQLLERCGFENIAAFSNSDWPVLSREFIFINPPEIIILEIKENKDLSGYVKELQNDSFWSKTPAVKNGKVYGINSQMIIVPGPRIIKAANILKEIKKEQYSKN